MVTTLDHAQHAANNSRDFFSRTRIATKRAIALLLLVGACDNFRARANYAVNLTSAVETVRETNAAFHTIAGFPELIATGDQCIEPPATSDPLPMPASNEAQVWVTQLATINNALCRLQEAKVGFARVIAYRDDVDHYVPEGHGRAQCFTRVIDHYIPILIQARDTMKARVDQTVISSQ